MKARRAYRDVEESSGGAAWLLTFSDLLLLLLTTFVMKLSMSSLQSDDLASGLGMTIERAVKVQEASLALAKGMKKSLTELVGAPVPLAGDRAALRFADELTLTLVDRGVLVSLGGGRFLAGRRELSPETKSFVLALAQSLLNTAVTIRVEGHTDSTPIATPEFPSNWELSAARAISVAQELVAQGIAGERIAAVGYGETRPIADNFSEKARSQNRRVELLIEPVD